MRLHALPGASTSTSTSPACRHQRAPHGPAAQPGQGHGRAVRRALARSPTARRSLRVRAVVPRSDVLLVEAVARVVKNVARLWQREVRRLPHTRAVVRQALSAPPPHGQAMREFDKTEPSEFLINQRIVVLLNLVRKARAQLGPPSSVRQPDARSRRARPAELLARGLAALLDGESAAGAAQALRARVAVGGGGWRSGDALPRASCARLRELMHAHRAQEDGEPLERIVRPLLLRVGQSAPARPPARSSIARPCDERAVPQSSTRWKRLVCDSPTSAWPRSRAARCARVRAGCDVPALPPEPSGHRWRAERN